jgi:hypothetical protein
MDSIFLSYRRAGTSGYGGRLHEGLREHFGEARVFRDVDSIPPGTDFVKILDEAVTRAGVVLALIGRDWFTTADAEGKRRIDDPGDFVRIELEAAFRRGVVVIPVLVDGARMPPPTALPESLARLSRIQAIELSDERWEYDLGRLITRLEQVVGPPVPAFVALDAAMVTKEHPALPTIAPPPEPVATARVEVEREPVDDYDDGPERETRRPPVSPWRAIFVVFGSVIVLLAIALMVAAVRPDRRSVPEVVGQEQERAVESLRRAGFFVVTEDVVAEEKPVGTVLGQKPEIGRAHV